MPTGNAEPAGFSIATRNGIRRQKWLLSCLIF
jgi:hypothetical protein